MRDYKNFLITGFAPIVLLVLIPILVGVIAGTVFVSKNLSSIKPSPAAINITPTNSDQAQQAINANTSAGSRAAEVGMPAQLYYSQNPVFIICKPSPYKRLFRSGS